MLYLRLPGRSRRLMGLLSNANYRLWLGDDHLLYVQSSSATRTFRRFYLADIQAFVITRTNMGKMANALILLLFLIITLPVLAFAPWQATAITAAIAAAILGPFLLINVVSGPTCKCVLHTAVQAEPIYCLGRLRTAQRVLDGLHGRIEAVQGQLIPQVPDELANEVFAPSTHIVQTAAAKVDEKAVHHEHGTVHAWLFAACLFFMVSHVVDIYIYNDLKNGLDALMALALVILAIAAMRRQKNSDLPPVIRRLTGIALGIKIAETVAFFTIAVALAFSDTTHLENLVTDTAALTRQPAYTAYFAVSAIISGVVGILGFTRLSAFRAAYMAAGDATATRPFSSREL